LKEPGQDQRPGTPEHPANEPAAADADAANETANESSVPAETAAEGAATSADESAPPGGEPAPTADAAEGVSEAEPAAATETADRPSRRARVRGWLRPPRSRRGLFALMLVFTATLGIMFVGTVTAIQWTETADFCGRCHSMGPELVAHDLGPHHAVTCAECHVEPGVEGWVKAKINGTRQLIEVILGTFPEPIPPPEHGDLPPVSDTCMECHRVPSGPSALVNQVTFTEDEPNTRQQIGLLVRPRSTEADASQDSRGVHWHVMTDVRYWTPDEDASSIDLISYRNFDGDVRTFIAQDKIEVAEDVQPDIDATMAAEKERSIDCISCHNRVGHPIPNPRDQTDQAMARGGIDSRLPYIKREAMRLLWSGYPDLETADAEIEKLSDFYELHYPDIAASYAGPIDRAITELKAIYRLSATPDMRVTAATYPDFLGHQDYPGCFRCHDGGHFLVEDGAVTDETIPSTCDTCHTFPQIGGVASLPLGTPPDSHDDSLWVFNHKTAVDTIDPGGTTCGDCHAKDYCVNCHATGAVLVDHDEMLLRHGEVVRANTNQSCAYCHQETYCARCHTQPKLPSGRYPETGHVPTAAAPEGIRWPLAWAGTPGGSVVP
jgi:nitrate/TMAO reductase-like tetraheme cytochrome c subunit